MLRIRRIKLLRIVVVLGVVIGFTAASRSLLSNYAIAGESDFTADHSYEDQIDRATGAFLGVQTSYHPKFVTITYGNKSFRGITYGATIKDALTEFGISVSDNLEVNPTLETPLTSDIDIWVNELLKERKVEFEEIEFKSITVLDDTRELDTTTVTQTGRTGMKKVVYEYLFRNGVLESKTPVREEFITQPQDEIISIGTMRVFRELSMWNPIEYKEETFSYWKKMTVWATSYDRNCDGCNDTTATGRILVKGICAVDPKVIPLHTNFYVPNYGFCQAEDVGGAIKGNRIDLGYEDRSLPQYANTWSSRSVEIYILD